MVESGRRLCTRGAPVLALVAVASVAASESTAVSAAVSATVSASSVGDAEVVVGQDGSSVADLAHVVKTLDQEGGTGKGLAIATTVAAAAATVATTAVASVGDETGVADADQGDKSNGE